MWKCDKPSPTNQLTDQPSADSSTTPLVLLGGAREW